MPARLQESTSQDFSARQAHNQRISAAIVFCFLVFFVLVGVMVDYLYLDAFTPTGLAFPLATVLSLSLATGMTVASYYKGSGWIMGSMGAEGLNRELPEHRELHNIVTEMALASGCPMPKVYVIFDPSPNAFATGKDEFSSSVCVTTGLLALLNREETQGVIAHELSHIRNQDTLALMLVSVLLGGIVLLSEWAQHSFYSSRTARRLRGTNVLFIIPGLLLIVFAPLISRMLAMAVSRQREYLADATAVEFTRNPLGLARALEKIRDAAMPFHKATRATAHLFFANPLRRRIDDREGMLADLLSTHPPLHRRISLLYRMAGLHLEPSAESKAHDRLPGL